MSSGVEIIPPQRVTRAICKRDDQLIEEENERKKRSSRVLPQDRFVFRPFEQTGNRRIVLSKNSNEFLQHSDFRSVQIQIRSIALQFVFRLFEFGAQRLNAVVRLDERFALLVRSFVRFSPRRSPWKRTFHNRFYIELISSD